MSFFLASSSTEETVSKYSGKLVSDLTPSDQQVTDFFASFAVPTEVDESYSGIADFTAAESLNSAPCSAGQIQKRNQVLLHDIDPTREIWEKAAQDWLKENNAALADATGKVTCEDIAQAETPKISISNFNAGDVVNDKNPTVTVEASAPSGVNQVLYYLNGSLQYKENQSPFSGKIRLPRNNSSAPLKLTVRIFDNDGRIGEDAVTIYAEKPASDPVTSDESNP